MDDVVAGILNNLWIYCVGRAPNIADTRELREIMEAHRGKEFAIARSHQSRL